jgi:hypothetical protein
MRYFSPTLIIACLLLNACSSSNPQPDAVSGEAAAKAPQPLPDAGAMIKQMITQDGCRDFTAEMRMTAEDESGKRDQVEFRIQRKYSDDRAYTFLAVISPREDADKALLTIERADQPTEAFSYLSGLKKLTKFSSDRQLGFHGAKVTVQEMLGMELARYTHGAGERVEADGESLIKIEFKEKEYSNLAFPRIVGFFHEKEQSPARFELFNLSNELQKAVRIEQVKTIQNRRTITRLAIDDLQQKLKIKVETRSIVYDRGLPDKLFTEDHLKSFINNAVRRLDQQ